MRWEGNWGNGAGAVVCCLAVWCTVLATLAAAGETRFAVTNSRSQYAHWIDLYDANDHRIDPTDPNAAPYSPFRTCGRCHDYEAIRHGWHFNAMHEEVAHGRRGEPWIWVDTRTGTQLPLSYRGWRGTYDPRQIGITEWEFVLQFGRHMPGGGPGELASSAPPGTAAKAETEPSKSAGSAGRWALSGQLQIDCMVCHMADMSYSLEAWRDQIAKQNFAWASTAAAGLGTIQGSVSELPDSFDPTKPAEGSGPSLPKTTYSPRWINAERKVFLDIVRRPLDNACYNCHSNQFVGERAAPAWTHDEDVHLRAGMTCSDCHRNGIEHHTVRGYWGEQQASGLPVETLTCRGCHMDQVTPDGKQPGGRLGAPKPLHRGLPTLHLDQMSCTSCHSGPPPSDQALQIQTAMAHGLGLPSHDYSVASPPGIVAPVLLKDGPMLYPHRLVWPAFWGMLQGDKVTPLHPEAVNEALRRVLRVRRGSSFAETMSEVKLTPEDKGQALGEDRARVPDSELSDDEKAKLAEVAKARSSEEFRKKLADALKALQTAIKQEGALPVYISGGRLYQLVAEGKVQVSEHPAAEPYAWKFGHDVRPARQSSGATSCFECHSVGAPIFESKITALGPAPDADPVTAVAHQYAGFNKFRLDAWSQSFQGRAAFKYFGFASMTIVGLVVLSYALAGIQGLVAIIRRG